MTAPEPTRPAEHTDAVARVVAGLLDDFDTVMNVRMESREVARRLLTSTDPAVHAAMLDALARAGVLAEDREPGMVVDIGDRVRITKVDDHRVWISDYEGTELHREGRSWWLIEDAPESEGDPDAEALDQMAQAMANLDGSDDADEWVPWAEVALDALRETHDVTPRAEQ